MGTGGRRPPWRPTASALERPLLPRRARQNAFKKSYALEANSRAWSACGVLLSHLPLPFTSDGRCRSGWLVKRRAAAPTRVMCRSSAPLERTQGRSVVVYVGDAIHIDFGPLFRSYQARSWGAGRIAPFGMGVLAGANLTARASTCPRSVRAPRLNKRAGRVQYITPRNSRA